MRNTVTVCLPAVVACIAACGGTAYDVCLALDLATPVAVRVIRPPTERADAVAIVHFRRVEGARDDSTSNT